MINKSLDKALANCEEPIEDIIAFANFIHDAFEIVENIYGKEHGILAIRVACEVIRARSVGINPDISALSELVGVSRDTIRRADAAVRQHVDLIALKMEGRRRVFEDDVPVSDGTAQALDQLVRLWRKSPV